jgi:protein gp37
MSLAPRLKAMGSRKYQRDGDPRTSGPGFGVTTHPELLAQPLAWRTPRRVFVNSMSDLFHSEIPGEFIAAVFATMARTPQHTYQVLTKRHGRMRSLLTSEAFRRWMYDSLVTLDREWINANPLPWPLPNVWLGVSVEDQKRADLRIPPLLATPAAVRFLSMEPLLGAVDLRSSLRCQACGSTHRYQLNPCDRISTRRNVTLPDRPSIDWVIVGGESGPEHRPMDPAWPRALRDQCTSAGVPFFFKQWGGRTPKANGRELDGRTWDEYPQAVTA